jgi:hypothetical protein
VSAKFEVMLEGGNGLLGTFNSPCVNNDAASYAACEAACVGTGCDFAVVLPAPRATPYVLRVRSVMFNTTGVVVSVSWLFQRCLTTEYAVLR